MKLILNVLLILCSAQFCIAQVPVEKNIFPIKKVLLPQEVSQEVSNDIDPELQNLQWNRWTSENFTVCSTNDQQAQYLVENLDNIKKWIYTRWGFEDFKFKTECRLICVDDPALFEKFFQIKQSRAEMRVKEDGKPELFVVFYLLDKKPSETIPGPLTDVCLYNIDATFEIKTPVWVASSMRELNENIPRIRETFQHLALKLDQDAEMYFSRGLMEMSEETYKTLPEESRKLFDENAAAFSLMMTNSYGIKKFHTLYKRCGKGEKPETVLQEVYGMTYDQCDQKLKKFLTSMTTNVSSIPDSKFQIP